MDRRLLTTQTHACRTPCVHDCNVTSLYHVHAQIDNFCAQSECFGYAAYMCIKDSRPREYKSAHCILSSSHRTKFDYILFNYLFLIKQPE